MEKQELSRLAGHLQDFFGNRQWHTLWQAFTITQNWHQIVGPEIAGRSQPACIQKNVLWVHVRDSVWMQQLQAMKPRILECVQRGFPEAAILDIRWRLQTAEPLAAAPRTGKGKIRPDPEQARAFARMTAFIDNKECRDALNRLWLSFHQHGNNDELSS
jgi:predicted nucleic acid-binding Zn ribbon protein